MSNRPVEDLRCAASVTADDGAGRFNARWTIEILVVLSVIAFASLVVPLLVYEADLTETDIGLVLIGGGWSFDMNQRPVDVLFVGNSLVQNGIDVFAFTRETGRTAKALWTERSAGGWWYLVFDQVIAKAQRHPSLVVFCFIDDWLTRTSLAHGQEAVQRALALLGHEDRLASAADQMAAPAHSDAFVFLEKNWSLISVRGQVRERFEQAVKGHVARLAGRSPAMLEGSLDRVFGLGARDAELVDRRASQRSDDLRLYDFERVKERSFLPDLLATASAERIPIVFLHMPRKDAPWRRERTEVEAARRRYLADLERYLTDRGFALVDLSAIDGLTPDHFGAGDHLTAAGRALFMPALEAALEPYLQAAEVAQTP
jgi:hypothetical protein